MRRHDFLAALHATYRPRNYLEIGVSDGGSLRLSRVPSIGVDPAFNVTKPLRCDLQLVRATSDDFFARRDPIRHFRSGRNPFRNVRRGRHPFGRYIRANVVDLAFIDGMHMFEFALRDFMNVERFSGPGSVIVFDDMLPRNVAEAARKRHTSDWAGDVYKLLDILRRHRPDLIVLPMNTQPTGVLVVLGADPSNSALQRAYVSLLADYMTPDPQPVPDDVLRRTGAVDPRRFLESPIVPLVSAMRSPFRWSRDLKRLRGLAADLQRVGFRP